MRNLYLLTTGIGDFYVIAEDPTKAQELLENLLNEKDYGFYPNRKVTNIKFLSKELDLENLYLLDKDSTLLIK